MKLSQAAATRCGNILLAVQNLHRLTLNDLMAGGIGGSKSTTDRLINLHGDSPWTTLRAERAAQFIARYVEVPADQALAYFLNGQAEYEQPLRELEVLGGRAPKAQMALDLGGLLRRHEDAPGILISFDRCLPLSLLIDEVNAIDLRRRTAPLGKVGARLFGTMMTHARSRRTQYIEGQGFPRARHTHLIPDSTLESMRRTLDPAYFHDIYNGLVEYTLRQRHARIGIIHEAQLPLRLQRYFAPFDTLMTLGTYLVMATHRNRLTCSFHGRNQDEQKNRYIDEVRGNLVELCKCVPYDMDSMRATLDALKKYKLP